MSDCNHCGNCDECDAEYQRQKNANERSELSPAHGYAAWATCEYCKQPIKSPQAGKRKWTHGGKYGYVGYVNVHRGKCPTETVTQHSDPDQRPGGKERKP